MTVKLKNIVIVFVTASFLFGLSAFFIFGPDKIVSESERRLLKTFPDFNVSSVMSGQFMQDFETYAADQLPLRDRFRSIKAFCAYYLFRQSDVNDIYLQNGYASKLDYPQSNDSLDYAASRFTHIFDKYLKSSNTNVYLSVIPDKNCFLASQNGYPSIDFNDFVRYLRENTEYMQYIDISGCLELTDYYKTDTHWRQEEIEDVAQTLVGAMGVQLENSHSPISLENPFYGVYCGQSALNLPPEKILYLTDEVIENFEVYDYETDSNIPVYDMEKAYGKDPYEMFLSGSKSLLRIKNDAVSNGKKLIVFRDSFGSSIAPLLAEGYSETFLIDIRYISPDILGSLVDFDNSDVLFLYSTLVLNNSVTLK